MPILPPGPHLWFSPAECARMLDGRQHGEHWRAVCPVHGGDNPEALKISEGRDQYGNPCTLFYCFAHACSFEDICAALGIPPRHMYAIQPDYAKATRYAPRAKSSGVQRLKTLDDPTPDAIAQAMLADMLIADPAWIHACAPARQQMWAWAQASPQAYEHLTWALRMAQILPSRFWQALRDEQGG